MKRFMILFIPFLLCFLITGCEKRIIVEKSARDYIGLNYEKVVKEFQELGLSNIEIKTVEDILPDSELSVGDIENISINDNSNFEENTEVTEDAVIVITYHELMKYEIPVSAEDVQQYDYEELAAIFAEVGFTNIETEVVYDLDPDTTEEKYRNEVNVNFTPEFLKGEKVPYDTCISITCHKVYNKYTVKVNVDFWSNLLFNKYDVAFAVDYSVKEYLSHGEDKSFEMRVAEGTHRFSFLGGEEEVYEGSVSMDVYSDMDVAFEIKCDEEEIIVYTDYIDRDIELAPNEVKMLSDRYQFRNNKIADVVNQLKKYGFTNIKEIPIYDLASDSSDIGNVENVSINGDDEYNKGSIFDKNDEVIVSYHQKKADMPPTVEVLPDGVVLGPDEVMLSKSAYDYSSYYYQDAANELKSVGFKNVTVETIYDLNTGFLGEAMWGDVEDLIIGDIKVFDENTIFNLNDPVKIIVRKYKIEDPSLQFMVVSVNTLISEIDANAMRASEKYEDKLVELTGRIDLIESNGSFSIYPTNNQWEFRGVSCKATTEEQKKILMNYSKGNVITVKGKLTTLNEWGGDLTLYRFK